MTLTRRRVRNKKITSYSQIKGGQKGGQYSSQNSNVLICNINMMKSGAPTRT